MKSKKALLIVDHHDMSQASGEHEVYNLGSAGVGPHVNKVAVHNRREARGVEVVARNESSAHVAISNRPEDRLVVRAYENEPISGTVNGLQRL